jgi:hypothetical protein
MSSAVPASGVCVGSYTAGFVIPEKLDVLDDATNVSVSVDPLVI